MMMLTPSMVVRRVLLSSSMSCLWVGRVGVEAAPKVGSVEPGSTQT